MNATSRIGTNFSNSIYKRLAPRTTHKTHIFSATKDNKTTIVLQDDALPETIETTQDLMKQGTNTAGRSALLKPPALNPIKAPGVPPIKQVELFTKYRNLIPEAFREITCPHPGDEILKKIKSERNTKQRDCNKKMKMSKVEDKKAKEDEDDDGEKRI